jgi:hypothetical protein
MGVWVWMLPGSQRAQKHAVCLLFAGWRGCFARSVLVNFLDVLRAEDLEFAARRQPGDVSSCAFRNGTVAVRRLLVATRHRCRL